MLLELQLYFLAEINPTETIIAKNLEPLDILVLALFRFYKRLQEVYIFKFIPDIC